jgi:hypothetical protein
MVRIDCETMPEESDVLPNNLARTKIALSLNPA